MDARLEGLDETCGGGVSETQALKLINSPADASAGRFSKKCGFASKSQLSKPHKPKSSNITGAPVSRSIPVASSSALTTPLVDMAGGGGELIFATPVKSKPKKKRKATPNPQLDEMFGESDAESDVSIVTSPKTTASATATEAETKVTSSTSTAEPNRRDPPPPPPPPAALNESAFLKYSQVVREKEEEQRKRIGEPSHAFTGPVRTKKGRDDLKKADCVECGKTYLSLGYTVDMTNRKIWENCPHGRGRNKEARCGTPDHLWELDLLDKRVRGEEEDGEVIGGGGGRNPAASKRPRRKKPLGLGGDTSA